MGKVRVPLILAPMAGLTDRAFRLICRAYGADFAVSEMISAKALHYRDAKTAGLAKIGDGEGPVAVQIFGSEPGIMAEAAAMLTDGSYAGCRSTAVPAAIDINMGCPMRKIVSNGEGAALMRDPGKIEAIVRAVAGATYLPVTVKLRAGWDAGQRNAVECALAAIEGGAKAIAVHGRTREQLYAPPVDLETIAAVKKAAGEIPVIGNGGIACGADAWAMLAATGCDGLMIGQAAVGNPWIFREIRAALDGRSYTMPAPAERIGTAKEHLRLMVEDRGEGTAVRECRRHLGKYVRGMRGGAAFRERINRAGTPDALCAALDEIAAENRAYDMEIGGKS